MDCFGLVRLPEPRLRFGYDQALDDPRDGLTLFGPLDEGNPRGIRAGVVGTKDGITLFRDWVGRIQGPVAVDPPRPARPSFPGFEAAFRVPWDPRPVVELHVDPLDLRKCLLLDDRHLRVFRTVDLFAGRIVEAVRELESTVDVWFVVVPDDVRKYCRPRSTVERSLRVEAEGKLPLAFARRLEIQEPLFAEDRAAAVPYRYEVDFRNQLKARLLGQRVPTQVVREPTIADVDPRRDVMRPDVAWHLATAAFYKAGGRPWKLGTVRPGVCYLGLVFKQDDSGGDPRAACCAAQMFLDSGDGVVFRGALGPWYNPSTGDYHLSRSAARELVGVALRTYEQSHGTAPTELFVHGRTRFDNEEWAGLREAAGVETNVVGVRITEERGFRLFRTEKLPALRGLAWLRDERAGYLWTRGFVPRLQTYIGREVPLPLLVEVVRGEAPIETVLTDVHSLTKLNYNACRYADGQPVTLKFADRVGEVLTAGPIEGNAPLPFKFYI